ncbi:hypothetical protein ACFYSF_32470 [Streptomyces canus]|uniref:hypothetical protein n=1 Tax=Streptomyces canus TaxID=58343 RepID=UPI0036C9129B
MSGVAAAAIPPACIGDSAVVASRLPAQRDGLRSLPGGNQPGDRDLDDALRLGRRMRLRLLAAIRALLADPSLAGLGDAARLAEVVLYAKSRAPEGRRADLQSYIWGAELGRWLGMTESTVHHDVLPVLREADALHTRVVTNDQGHPVGLDCLVMPLWRAHQGGGASHPLALNKAELAVLLRLLEALFGPGWAPEGKEPTPPGLLAGRTGKGAATDRLGLLLMVLNTRASGSLQLCGGSVRKKEGRAAATLARLLGCSPSGARKVLARLTVAGVVARQRKATATRMKGRGRVMLPPVARAYGRTVAPVEAVQVLEAVFSARPDGACGDHAPADVAGAPGTTGLSGAEGTENAADRERSDGAELHAVHASVVTPVVPLQLSCGFSGEGREGEGRRPECACGREDGAAGSQDVSPELAPLVAEGGPLRGERPKGSPAVEVEGPVQAAGGGRTRLTVVTGGGRQQQERPVADLLDLRLRVALAPVAWLWSQLSSGQQKVAARAAGEALDVLEGISCPEAAPQLLAGRLTDRLEEAGGEALVREPMGWLLGRGLVQRPACSDRRCDDGMRLDTGVNCENCANVLHVRRARRVRAAAEVEAAMPGADPAQRRAAIEERLREHANGARARAAHAEAEVEVRRAAVARRRAEEEAAERDRRSAACAECGLPGAAGLCPACTFQRHTEVLVREAVDLAVVVRADLDDPVQVAVLTERCEVDTRALIADVSQRGADGALKAYRAREVAERIRDERRASALRRLEKSEEAETEADAVYEAFLWCRPRSGRPAQAAADEACGRTARYLLESKLGQLQVLRMRVAAGRAPRRAG